MGKLLLVVVLVAGVIAACFAGYNHMTFGVTQPFPLEWNHTEDELALVTLEHRQSEIQQELASVNRQAGAGGMSAPIDATVGQMEALKAEAVQVDAKIAALKEKIGAVKPS